MTAGRGDALAQAAGAFAAGVAVTLAIARHLRRG
jgi:hypothetical protein